MEKVTQMNKEIFKNNLIATVAEIREKKNVSFNDCKFIIVPVQEKNKPLSTEDDYMRLNILSKENIGGKKIPVKQTVGILAGLQPLVPIWINVSFYEMEEDTAIFKLETSLRFRKPTLLRNAETGHAPFKAIF
ncbi:MULTISPECIES: hypothetical protein [Listeria]|uniref:hypothetical protein n=1 Tax=Listeria TaxID=1637 RepID=UPI000B589C28|nr:MULTISPECIES: hypothetical protein [Listeria]